jgi:IS6 family transposase
VAVRVPAVDQYGQIIDVYVSARRDARAARRFFMMALRAHGEPVEVVTDRAPGIAGCDRGAHTCRVSQYGAVCEEPRRVRPRPTQSATPPHGRPERDHSARVIVRGHALMQNIRRGHYELGVETRTHRRFAAAFTELTRTI